MSRMTTREIERATRLIEAYDNGDIAGEEFADDAGAYLGSALDHIATTNESERGLIEALEATEALIGMTLERTYPTLLVMIREAMKKAKGGQAS